MLLLMVFWQQTSDFSSFPRSSTAALLCAVAVLHGLGCTGALALLPDTLAEECWRSEKHFMWFCLTPKEHTYTQLHTYVLYVYIYISIYIHTHTHIYIYIYTHTHVFICALVKWAEEVRTVRFHQQHQGKLSCLDWGVTLCLQVFSFRWPHRWRIAGWW